VLIEAEAPKISVFATDLETSIKDFANAKVIQAGKIAVNARNLFEIIKELKNEKIKITKQENQWIEISQGKFTAKLVTQVTDEFPVFPDFTEAGFVKVPVKDLREMIEKTLFSVSMDDGRLMLNGVFFEQKENGRLAAVSTDGFRLSLIQKDFVKPILPVAQGAIVPRKAIAEIKKILDGASQEQELDISFQGPQCILRLGNTTLMVRLIEGKYPNYNQFIPQKLKRKAIIPTDALQSSLRRISIFVSQKSKAVTMNFSENNLKISSINPDMGNATEELEIDYSGDNQQIALNVKYLQDILSVIDTKSVEIDFNDPQSTLMVKPLGDHNYRCIVMPMRL
jgi:DNA polymerase-3 subunit beta